MVVFDFFDPQPDVTEEETLVLKTTFSDLGETECSKFVLSCLYDKNCTLLYKKIEEEQWKDVASFLENGVWPGISSSFVPDFSPVDQAVTFVVSLDTENNVVWKRLPLHLAVEKCAPYSVISRLIDIEPEMVSVPDSDGNLPLHIAMASNVCDKSLAYITVRHPAAVRKENNAGMAPLQHACEKGKTTIAACRARVLLAFVFRSSSKSVPSAATSYTCEYATSCTMLYKMIELEKWKAVEGFLQYGQWTKPSIFTQLLEPNDFMCCATEEELDPAVQAKMVVRHHDAHNVLLFSRLPLHRAIMSHAPVEVVRQLINIYPESLLVKDHFGMLPLHLALHHGIDHETILLLLEQAPESRLVLGPKGKDCIEISLHGKSLALGEVLHAFVDAYNLSAVDLSEAENGETRE